jgi:hypothetical protein
MIDWLIDPDGVRQSGLGDVVPQQPVTTRVNELVKATVLRVYPIGHPANRLGQTVVDLEPLEDLPVLHHVPSALGHAHQETDREAPDSVRRQPYDPKVKNRIDGVSHDVRPGTQVWVQFQGGSLYDPVIVGVANFNGGDGNGERLHVDRYGDDGEPEDDGDGGAGLDSDMGAYPRSVTRFNGAHRVIDNRGNVYVRTSTDREPVFPGHNGIDAVPTPQGNYGVSTRGAMVGNVGVDTGKAAGAGDDETSVGRMWRRSHGAEDGSIVDETRDSKIGSIIKRIKSTVGRLWFSTEGSGDGRVYLENAKRHYVAMDDDGAEVHGKRVVLDGDNIYLGSGEVASNVVTHQELDLVVVQIMSMVDRHVHSGVETGEGISGPPTPATLFELAWSTSAQQCKAEGVFIAPSHTASPEPQDDPESA